MSKDQAKRPPRLKLVSAVDGDNESSTPGEIDAASAAGEQLAHSAQPAIANDADEASGADASAPPGQRFDTLTAVPASGRNEKLRIVEAVLFASSEPVDVARLASHLEEGDDIASLLVELQELYNGRGVNLVRVAGKWAMRTAADLSYLMERHAVEQRRLSKAALETLAIIAYHQPVTRAEIEDIRGVTTSKGTLDVLLDTGWIRPRGRRRAPGRPITYGTTEAFLDHFTLDSIKDLPGLQELKGAGLLDSNLPANFSMPAPTDVAALMPDELPLEDDEGEDAEMVEPEAGEREEEDLRDRGVDDKAENSEA